MRRIDPRVVELAESALVEPLQEDDGGRLQLMSLILSLFELQSGVLALCQVLLAP